MKTTNESLASNLKRLRRERDMTQEEVASALGVSPQTVSKWERGETCPDIAMLPPLAVYYSVSLDELLDVRGYVSEERRDEFFRRYLNEKNVAHYAQAVAICREALRAFPNEPAFLWALVEVLPMADPHPYTEPDESYLAETIEICEQLMTNVNMRDFAVLTLLQSYPKVGESNKAIALCESLPTLRFSREFMRPMLYVQSGRADNEEYTAADNQLKLTLFEEFLNRITQGGFGKPELQCASYTLAKDLLRLVLDEADLDGYLNYLISYNEVIATTCVMLGDESGALDAIEDMLRAAKRSAELADPNEELTTLSRSYKTAYFEGLENRIQVSSDALESLGVRIAAGFYDGLRGNPRYEAVIAEIG